MLILLTGPDTYRSHRRFDQLRAAFIAKHDPRGYNTAVLDATTATVEELQAALATAGFLTSKRFVGLNRYDAKNAAVNPVALKTLLAGYAKNDEVIVVVREVTAPAARRPRGKQAGTTGRRAAGLKLEPAKTERFPQLSETELVTWIKREAADRGGKITPAAVKKLVIACEQDSWRIASELDKLLAYAGNRAVSEQDVEALVATPYASDVFALTDALGSRQRARALDLLHRELAAGTHPLALIAVLANHIRNLAAVKAGLAEGQTLQALPQALHLHPYVVQKAAQQARQFEERQLADLHHRLVAIDYDLKTSRLDAETLLDALLLSV